MKKLISILIISVVLLFGCAKNDVETFGDKIEATDKVEDVKISCFQKVVLENKLFKPDYVYDGTFPPFVYLYIAGGWFDLNDDQQEEVLVEMGRKWYDCNTDNNGPLTLMAYDVNDMPVMAIFLDRGE